jgi:hypothetical protein
VLKIGARHNSRIRSRWSYMYLVGSESGMARARLGIGIARVRLDIGTARVHLDIGTARVRLKHWLRDTKHRERIEL